MRCFLLGLLFCLLVLTRGESPAQLSSAQIELNQGDHVLVGDIDLTVSTINADLSPGDSLLVLLPGYSGITSYNSSVPGVGAASYNQQVGAITLVLSVSFPSSAHSVMLTIPSTVTSSWSLHTPFSSSPPAASPQIGLQTVGSLEPGFVQPTTTTTPTPATTTAGPTPNFLPTSSVLPSGDGNTCLIPGSSTLLFAVGQTYITPDSCVACSCSSGGVISCSSLDNPSCSLSSPTTGSVPVSPSDLPNSLIPSQCTPGSAVLIIGCARCTCLPTGDRICAYQTGCVVPVPTVPAPPPSTSPPTSTPIASSAQCQYNGAFYAPKSTWTATDGCNTCGCSTSLSIVCSENSCTAPVPVATSVPVFHPTPRPALTLPPTAAPVISNNTQTDLSTNQATHKQHQSYHVMELIACAWMVNALVPIW